MNTCIRLLKRKYPYELICYNDTYYSVDYNTKSVGYSIMFTKDQEQAKKKFQELIDSIEGVEYNG